MTTGSVVVLAVLPWAAGQADESVVLPRLSPDQKANLRKFFDRQAQKEPRRFLPANARITAQSTGLTDLDRRAEAPKGEPIKQYVTLVSKLRPVPGQPEPTKVTVYVFRYHPEVGRQGVTLRYVVDLATGEADGDPEVLTRFGAPLAKEEEEQAVTLAREKSAVVQALFAAAGKGATVGTEVLSPSLSRAAGPHVPGDRIASVRFLAGQGKEAKSVLVWVNLTRRVVTPPPGSDSEPKPK
jgi:hypothetical protein